MLRTLGLAGMLAPAFAIASLTRSDARVFATALEQTVLASFTAPKCGPEIANLDALAPRR